MKIVILSTITKHHIYFINKILEKFNSTFTIFTKVSEKDNYKNKLFYEDDENKYEEKFFQEKKGKVDKEIKKEKIILKNVRDINASSVIRKIKEIQPHIGIIFGTKLISKKVYSLPRWGTINIHRGLTQFYRGLDSDLWPLFEKKFDKIGVTIHYVDENYDTGGILEQKKIKLKKKDKIFHLRYLTTIIATKLVLNLLERFKKKKKKIRSIKLLNKGNYKSHIPLKFKYMAEKNLENYLKHSKK